MSMEEPNNGDHTEPDPLLRPGTFIDPNPTSNGNSKPESTVDPPVVEPSKRSDQMGRSEPPPANAPVLERPDWLPPGWTLEERVRSSGATAGTRDKYYVDPVTNRRFRSKKEVLFYLETGTPKGKKKNSNSDADSTPATDSPTPKRKKSDSKAKNSLKNFNFDDVPAKIKWVLTDVYEEMWRPLVNGVDTVSESTRQEWTAVFTYLTLQNGGRPIF